jgi:ketosteroid isomerase-like protein
MITPQDIENLRAAYRDFNAGEMRADLLTDDFVLEQTPAIPGTRRIFRGTGALQASFEELRTGFDSVQIEPLDFTERDDWLIVTVQFQVSTHGIDQTAKIAHLWQVRDGRFAQMRVVGQVNNAEAVLETLRGR